MEKGLFYDEKNILIHEAIRELFKQGTAIDLLTVTNQLRKNGTLKQVGGAFAISELTNRVASGANLQEHCKILFEYALKRYLFQSSGVLKENAIKDTTDPLKLIREQINSLYEWTVVMQEAKEPIPMVELIAEYYDEFQKMEEKVKENGSADGS